MIIASACSSPFAHFVDNTNRSDDLITQPGIAISKFNIFDKICNWALVDHPLQQDVPPEWKYSSSFSNSRKRYTYTPVVGYAHLSCSLVTNCSEQSERLTLSTQCAIGRLLACIMRPWEYAARRCWAVLYPLHEPALPTSVE